MSEEKPLHVRVAEALGCKVVGPNAKGWDPDGGPWLYYCGCELSGHEWNVPFEARPSHEARDTHDPYRLAQYDTDWSATGPLIEKYKITLYIDPRTQPWDKKPPEWTAYYMAEHDYEGLTGSAWEDGATPLEAVCHLILALHEAGKLKAA